MSQGSTAPGNGEDLGFEYTFSLTFKEIMAALNEHALWKVRMCQAVMVLRAAGHKEKEIMNQLGLGREAYKRVDQWLTDAITGRRYQFQANLPPAVKNLTEPLKLVPDGEDPPAPPTANR